jgi:alkanesulfonate monooxygenase SsuD/methylene tetrahydromethanopterin reductase-like flavin-dependent oxidoreductase (luciferase family)
MANPHIGVSLPTMVDPTATQLADFAVRAESLGYDSLWAGDTLLRPVVEPLTALAAVSGVTSTIGLGTAAMLPAFRSPVQAAQTLASLDVVSGGRLTVAVGAGFPGRSEAEYAWSGVPWTRRFTRLDETVEFWRRLWTATEPVSFHGKVLRFDDVPPVTRPHGIPVWLAARHRGRLSGPAGCTTVGCRIRRRPRSTPRGSRRSGRLGGTSQPRCSCRS